MMRHISAWGRLFGSARFRFVWIPGALVMAIVWILSAKASATPALGVITNETLAMGVAPDGISERVRIKKTERRAERWHVQLNAEGSTDYYSHHLVLSPGGHSGWHSHPGLLVAAVKSGKIDFYDANCERQTIGPGEVYTEDDDVHAIVNTGAVDADLYITFLVKHGAPRRVDESAPACAVYTPIP